MAGYSILIVEDEHTLRRLLEYRLGKQYEVRTAANGLEALDRIGEKIPDLIISDIMMPKMDGFALQTEVQANPDTAAVPFIFLTAKADELSKTKGMRTGVDDYITKPFDIEQLLSRVDRLLQRASVFKTQLDAEIGQDFSQRLMPKNLPEVSNYRILFENNPLEHGGGDLFDWMEAKPGVFFFTIGDVMGKGLKAKFYAFSFLGYVRSTIHAMLAVTQSPAEIMQRVNKVLMDDPPMEETFASLLLIKWEPEKNLVTYTNAGHCRPLVANDQGAKVVEYSDMILGLDRNAEFKDTEVTIDDNSALIAYTDGLSEQVFSSGEMAGEGGLMEAAAAAFGDEQPIQKMLNNLLERSESNKFGDDILVFWMERKGLNWFAPFAGSTVS